MTDDYVTEALERVSAEDRTRFVLGARSLVAAIRANPLGYGSPLFELQRQALVRHVDDDPTWPLWMAWARSREVGEAFDDLMAGLSELLTGES